ncbi:MAG: UbiA prenyltransferase family protein [Patescibacteria group bacterium]|nr:UbiA prenyltransferase family protein [Patescibacteria group bacterium]
MRNLLILFETFRISQWLKNLVIFTSIVFAGKLFETRIFLITFVAFLIFCLMSSASYILNDIIDYPYDRKHPLKKNRPIASGKISLPQATFIFFLLTISMLTISLFISIWFFIVCFVFVIVHFFYSLFLKNYPVIDIFTISFSFVLRAYAGVVTSGYHIPVWMMLTIFFLSLFMASVKRHAELVAQGRETRLSLYRYNEHFLDFLTYTAATTAIICYSFYTYFEKPPQMKTLLGDFSSQYFPLVETRKLMMITIPVVVYGITRYAQLLYEKYEGERPEKIITSDLPLIIAIVLWSGIIITLIYIL